MKPPLVLAYTSTGRGECIAFSADRGRTWKEYDKNPIVKHTGRDPKLIWHQKAKLWVMAVYDEFQGKRWIAFYNSPDLKNWTYASRIEGFFECPDLFELPLNNDPKNGTKWVLYTADGKYLTGDFDGKAFKADSKVKKQLWYGRFYAAQTFDNAPMQPQPMGSGAFHPRRPWRIQIGWAERPRHRASPRLAVVAFRGYNTPLLFIPGAFPFPRAVSGTGGHHVCGAGRPPAPACAEMPLWTVAKLAIPGRTPPSKSLGQRRSGGSGARYGSWGPDDGRDHPGAQRD